ARIQSPGERVRRPVRNLQSMTQVTRAEHCQHRAENLFLGNCRGRGDIRKDVRTDVVALSFQLSDVGCIGKACLLLPPGDVAQDALARLLVDNRTDRAARIIGWCDSQTARGLDQAGEKGLVQGIENQYTRACGTFL